MKRGQVLLITFVQKRINFIEFFDSFSVNLHFVNCHTINDLIVLLPSCRDFYFTRINTIINTCVEFVAFNQCIQQCCPYFP